MELSKNQFFALLFALLFTPFLVQKLIWLAGTNTANGTMRFMGKNISGQITSVYPVISFIAGKDTVWFNGEGDNNLQPGTAVPVRYSRNDIHDARINTFFSIWMDSIFIAGVPGLMLLLIYMHKSIFPKGTRFHFGRKPLFSVIPPDEWEQIPN